MTTTTRTPARADQLLLIEDSQADIGLVRQALEEAEIPAELIVANNARKALELLRPNGDDLPACRPDLILLDLNMPGGGKEVLREIKADPDLRMIPVLILSHSACDPDVCDCYRSYANCYLTKPLELDDFVSMLRSAGQFWLQWARLPNRHR
jgi:CheY-like chemotaxis protein